MEVRNVAAKDGKFYSHPEEYYDAIAHTYDTGKKKNLYYFQNLVTLYSSLMAPRSTVTEVGCGTGDLIAALNPPMGIGLDISEQMIQVARGKYAEKRNIRFERCNISDSKEPFSTDYIILADVLEHVEHLEEFLSHLAIRTRKESKIIITLVNPILLWEIAMAIAEKLNMKIPEGPHERVSVAETEILFKKAGFRILEKGYRFLIPKKIPFSESINRAFHTHPFLAKYGFTIYWVLSI